MKRPQLTDAKIVVYPAVDAVMVDGEPASASRMRAAYQNEDWETFKKLLPSEYFYDDVVHVLTKGGSLAENFQDGARARV
jgi:citrate lyase synthetase